MSRELTTEVSAEIDKQEVTPILLVEMEFDSETMNLWSGVGDLSWDSKTWLGTGILGSISAVQETRNIEAQGMTFSMTGIQSDLLSLALLENYQYRPVKCWLGFLDDSSQVITDPEMLFSGLMDVMEIQEQGETSMISIVAENRLVDLLRPREWRYTHEDQQIDYPGDMGLEFVAGLQDKDVTWGP